MPPRYLCLSRKLLILAAVPFAVSAQPAFEECLAELERAAVENGISPSTTARVLPSVRQLPRVVEADRDQPELVQTFAAYLDRRVTPGRIATGRERLREHRPVLERVAASFGVPPNVLVAIWGLETSYGRVLGNVPVLDSLATLACDGRRGRYFTSEFVNALRIVEQGVPHGSMIGSWAGAMGQTQFMPSVYLRHAVDGDGDGTADLRGSVEDAFASAANFLRNLGWRPGWRWGREVLLPDGFDYALAGRDRPRTLRAWHALGVETTSGQPVPALDERAALLVPAGHRGPAFLVYENFEVIMRWNRSELFALAIGHLADRIAGAGPLHAPPPDGPRVSRARIEMLQRRLSALGYDSGEPDGLVGPATRRAVRAWQAENGRVADGYVDAELLRRLNIPLD